MIKFIDLESGSLYDGVKKSDNYIFWFPGEQSVDLVYTHKICFIKDEGTAIVSIPQNPIYTFINPTGPNDQVLDLNNIKLPQGIDVELEGNYFRGSYVYMLYIMASSKVLGECIEDFYIDGELYSIGADFYGENEELTINMLNNGLEIPTAIQRAVYGVDIEEGKDDNILLNRKWKELLSNYWDLIANKGSYKSLYNTLKWFEYGDTLKLYEVWKRYDKSRVKFEVRNIQEILGDKYFESMQSTVKTTYIAIYLALEEFVKDNNGSIKYDKELNPLLQRISYDWSKDELSLKLALLANFYQTYFMPIHLDLVHATIEDVVFTNTFKSITSPLMNREDFILNYSDFRCNVKDGDEYQIKTVKCFTGPQTLFGRRINIDIINENREPYLYLFEQKSNAEANINATQELINETNLALTDIDNTLAAIEEERYNISQEINANPTAPNVGDLVARHKELDNDFELYSNEKQVTQAALDEYNNRLNQYQTELSDIQREIDNTDINLYTERIIPLGVSLTPNVGFNVMDDEYEYINYSLQRYISTGVIVEFDTHIPLSQNDYIKRSTLCINGETFEDYKKIGTSDLKFNILFTEPGEKSLKLMFETVSGMVYVKSLNINIVDEYKCGIKVYKIKSLIGELPHPFNRENKLNNYYFSRQIDSLNDTTAPFIQYIPTSHTDGVKLNHLLILAPGWNETGLTTSVITNHYHTIGRKLENGSVYTICISKEFWYDYDIDVVNKLDMLGYVYRHDYIFIPEYHDLHEIGYTSSKHPSFEDFIITDKDALCIVPDISFGKAITGYEWEFINNSDPLNSSIRLDRSIKEPFVASPNKEFLKPGYYDIVFRYRLSGEKIHEVKISNAFLKK